MSALEKWKNDFKEFISELSMPEDDYNGIMEYINEVPNEALEQEPCEDVISRDCDKCAYYVNGANDEACDGCFEDEYEHPNFKPKTQHCDDCISRQAAIDVIDAVFPVDPMKSEYAQGIACGAAPAKTYVEQLPSAQPELAQDLHNACTDAISRQAVLDAINTYDKFGYTETGCFVREPEGDYVPYIHYDDVIKCIKNAPPVTPKEKTGKWISFGIQGEIDGQIIRAFTCSKCGAISIFRVSNGNIVNGDLCPNCGAKMQEVEE